MNQRLNLLKKVIFEVLQDMFFLFPDELDDDESFEKADNPTIYSFSIPIDGNGPFKLRFFLTFETGKQMASNYLGEEEKDIDHKLIIETFKEAVNVLGGNYLNIIGTDHHLGLPEYHDKTSLKNILKVTENNINNSIKLKIEGEPFLAIID